MVSLPQGIYEALLNEELGGILRRHPELRSVFGKLDPEEQPARYSAFVATLLEKVLRIEDNPSSRLQLCNEPSHRGRQTSPA
jgi:isochorismate hydrolase